MLAEYSRWIVRLAISQVVVKEICIRAVVLQAGVSAAATGMPCTPVFSHKTSSITSRYCSPSRQFVCWQQYWKTVKTFRQQQWLRDHDIDFVLPFTFRQFIRRRRSLQAKATSYIWVAVLCFFFWRESSATAGRIFTKSTPKDVFFCTVIR